MMRSRATALVIMLAAVLAAGCGNKVPPAAPAASTSPVAAAPAPATRPAEPSAPANPAPRALTEDERFARKTLDELNAEAPLKSVFFALDDSTISDDGRSVLQANARWLARWPSTRIAIEGHCDDRGTAEYNLALGERRAAAISAYLTSLGVSADRLLMVSKGKDAPVCREQHDNCHQQNRRGQFVFTAK